MVFIALNISISRHPSTTSRKPSLALSYTGPEFLNYHQQQASTIKQSAKAYRYPNAPLESALYLSKRLSSEEGTNVEESLGWKNNRSFSRGRNKERRFRFRKMTEKDVHIEGGQERKKSYGIGGAGNIRRPSEVIYAPRTNADGTRHRSSVWSSINISPSTSPDSKRGTFMSFFGWKGSANKDVDDHHDTGEGSVKFNDVDLSGRKKSDVE